MKKWCLILGVLILSGCASSVNVDYDQQTNFALVKTFRVQVKPEKIADDPRVNSSFMQQRVVAAINEVLSKKELSPVQQDSDVVIKYYLDIQKELETDEPALSLGYGISGRRSSIGFVYGFPGSEVATVENLVMTIDIQDSKSEQLLWRGSYARRFMAGSTPESSNRLVRHLTETILKEFPPK